MGLSVMEQVEKDRDHRWHEGMADYRKPDQPFQGNPWTELYEELLDSMNYLEEGVLQREGTKTEARWPLSYRSKMESLRRVAAWALKQRDTTVL